MATQASAAVGVAKARDLTPEEKAKWAERGLAGLSIAAQVGSIAGGKKTKIASTIASAALAHRASSSSSAAAPAAGR